MNVNILVSIRKLKKSMMTIEAQQIIIKYFKLTDYNVKFKGGGGADLPLFETIKTNATQELSQKMSYSSKLWYGSCFYDFY